MKLESIKRRVRKVFQIKAPLERNTAGIKMMLVFHMNQNQVPFAYLADDVCYEILLKTLQEIGIPFVLNISGPLLKVLMYKKSPTLSLVRQLVAEGRCELVSSSYAEDISIVTPERLRKKSILLHRKMVEQVFGVRVKGFWSSERVWSQELVKLVAECGFEYSFVENTILQRSNEFKDRTFSSFQLAPSGLRIFPDIKEFKWAVDNFVNSDQADFDEVNRNIRTALAAQAEPLITFAEDAEMFRIWAMEKKNTASMDRDVDNLELLLSSLIESGYEFVLPASFSTDPGAEGTVDAEMPTGWANWMDVCCREKDRFFYEEGYQDWKDFIERSPKISRFSSYFHAYDQDIEDRKQVLGQTFLTEEVRYAAGNLLRLAEIVLISHLYEFGCVGIGGDDYYQWLDASHVEVVLKAFDCLIHDAGTGFEEYGDDLFFRSGKFAGVIDRNTGSILHLFDLKRGISFRDYSTHFYGEKLRKVKEEAVRLNLGENLWEWLKDSENVPQIYSRFRLNRFVLRVDLVEKFQSLIIDYRPPVISGDRITFHGSFLNGKLSLSYQLKGDEIICSLVLNKEFPSQGLFLELSALPDPLAFTGETFKGFQNSDRAILSRTCGSCLCYRLNDGEIRDVNRRKDFFSFVHVLSFGNGTDLQAELSLYSL